jgi:chromosome segregation ATPase
MKDKAPIIVLFIVIVGLGLALIVVNNKNTTEREIADSNIKTLSNNWTSVRASLDEQQSVNRALETNLTATTTEYSNKLAARDAQLAGIQADLAKAQAEAKTQAEAAAAEVAQRDKRIAALENQNLELDKQSTDLRGSIVNLESQISATQKKLAASEGDRTALIKELKELQAKKDELEKRFNDLVALKEQVHKLKEELSVVRHLDWIRRGIYEALNEKGGEKLAHAGRTVPPVTNSTLNVELKQNGEVKIQTPAPATNAPAKTN